MTYSPKPSTCKLPPLDIVARFKFKTPKNAPAPSLCGVALRPQNLYLF